jgi:hypothetical protein
VRSVGVVMPTERPYRRDDLVRVYRRQHPIALWMALGIGFTGLIGLLFPSTIEQTVTTMALPHGLNVAFYVLYTLSGFTMWWGLHTRQFKIEAASEVALSIALFVQAGAILYVHPLASVLFVLFLAIGVGRRAWHLTRDY